jgi:hypothetical protein
MERILTLWPIYAPGIALVGIGLGMIRLEEFKVARALFWGAGIFLAVTDFVWQLVTDSPFVVRALNGSVAGIVIFLIFPILLRWLRNRELRFNTSSDTAAGPSSVS